MIILDVAREENSSKLLDRYWFFISLGWKVGSYTGWLVQNPLWICCCYCNTIFFTINLLSTINSDIRSDVLSTELASLTQGWSNTVDVYMSEKWHRNTQTCAWLLAAGQVRAPLEVTLYLSSTSTLAQCYLDFGILPSLVASLTFFFKVSQNVMRNEVMHSESEIIL